MVGEGALDPTGGVAFLEAARQVRPVGGRPHQEHRDQGHLAVLAFELATGLVQEAIEVGLIPFLQAQVDDNVTAAEHARFQVGVDRRRGRFKVDFEVFGVLRHARRRRQHGDIRQPIGPGRGGQQAIGQFLQLAAGKSLSQVVERRVTVGVRAAEFLVGLTPEQSGQGHGGGFGQTVFLARGLALLLDGPAGSRLVPALERPGG